MDLSLFYLPRYGGVEVGILDVYVDGDTAAQRVAANPGLDEIRRKLWDVFA